MFLYVRQNSAILYIELKENICLLKEEIGVKKCNNRQEEAEETIKDIINKHTTDNDSYTINKTLFFIYKVSELPLKSH